MLDGFPRMRITFYAQACDQSNKVNGLFAEAVRRTFTHSNRNTCGLHFHFQT
jgi:hypothetical protein